MEKEKRMFQKTKHVPNMLTFSNMAVGVLVILTMMRSNSVTGTRLACLLIYLAVIFDSLDGFLARHLNATSELGRQLDSFADFVTFGVAPISIFMSRIEEPSWYVLFELVMYPLAGAFRLARYNLQDDYRFFKGLPITAAGFITASTLFIHSFVSQEFSNMFVLVFVLQTILLSFLMVGSFRVKRILH